MTGHSATLTAGRGTAQRVRRTFTLVELLVALFIIALLLSILVPALASARNETKAFVCMDHLRASAFAFTLFADPYTCKDRGDSAQYSANTFSATDFQESVYEVSEFWHLRSNLAYAFERYRRNQKPIVCPAGPRGLGRAHGIGYDTLTKCVLPPERVSYAMNRRLYRAPATLSSGAHVGWPVLIDNRVFDHPHVPLIFDVDADAAVKNLETPFFAAPPSRRGEPSVYDNNRFWFPAQRHNGRLSIAFVGGHVISTTTPLSDASWDWEYHPPIR